jgi:hypothetical protein
VARYLFKLMAYKDEYEVARLHTDPAFTDKIAGMFEGDYKLVHHLAPPLPGSWSTSALSSSRFLRRSATRRWRWPTRRCGRPA